MREQQGITVVIPTLDEGPRICAAVESVAAGASEVIVVDGGSADATVPEAASAGARVIAGPRGRASQMQAGAREAVGDWLVFLHADTRLETGWHDALRALDARFVAGAFRLRLDSPRARYRLVEAAVRRPSRPEGRSCVCRPCLSSRSRRSRLASAMEHSAC